MKKYVSIFIKIFVKKILKFLEEKSITLANENKKILLKQLEKDVNYRYYTFFACSNISTKKTLLKVNFIVNKILCNFKQYC